MQSPFIIVSVMMANAIGQLEYWEASFRLNAIASSRSECLNSFHKPDSNRTQPDRCPSLSVPASPRLAVQHISNAPKEALPTLEATLEIVRIPELLVIASGNFCVCLAKRYS